MTEQFAGKVVVITGGAQGIGAASAELFARRGAHVVIADVAVEQGERLVESIVGTGGQAEFVYTDVTDEEQCRRLTTTALRQTGRLDILITSAGVFRGGQASLEDLEESVFRGVIDINLIGTFRTVKHAVPAMQDSGGSVILCIASGAGVTGASGSYAYGASKGGVHGLVLTLQARLEPRGIRVHTICPGEIATPLKLSAIAQAAELAGRSPDAAIAEARERLGEADGVARVLAFLASDEASYVRGTIFTR
jgi:NAD(P)-dependent dehydrogenase (short-subunit alcohol dehydrogenase family)